MMKRRSFKDEMKLHGSSLKFMFSTTSARSRMPDALPLAAEFYSAKTVKKLIEAGADINGRNAHGMTALMCALANGKEDVAALILEERPKIDAVDKCKWTALMYAAYSGSHTIAKKLVEAGAEMDVCNSNGDNALCIAICGFSKEVENRWERDDWPEHGGITDGHIKTLQVLIDAGASYVQGDFLIIKGLPQCVSYSTRRKLEDMLTEGKKREPKIRQEKEKRSTALQKENYDQATSIKLKRKLRRPKKIDLNR